VTGDAAGSEYARVEHDQLAAGGEQGVEGHQGEHCVDTVLGDPVGDGGGDAGENDQGYGSE
jgi:hypothetical protein